MTKASKQDVEMLKRLVVEFKDELDALGVKVDKIDSRLAVIEERLGGWKISGEFRFDAKFGGEGWNNVAGVDEGLYGNTNKNRFQISRYRIWLRKYIDDKVTFNARLGGSDIAFERYWIDVKFPWDIAAKIGLWDFDWEGEDGLYTDNDAMFTDRALRGFYFNKPFAMGNFAFFATRPDEGNGAPQGVAERYEIGARAKFNFNEQLWLSLNGMMRMYDSDVLTSLGGGGVAKEDEHIYWGALGINFTPAIALKAAYYAQEVQVGDNVGTESPNSFQAIVDIKQDALKFTSFWAEYRSFDDNFTTWMDGGPWDNYGAAVTGPVVNGMVNIGSLYDSAIFFKLNQKWNDQWSTFQRYLIANARNEIAGQTDNTTNWTFGVKYNYTPALSFELVYDKIENAGTAVNDDDSLVRFRTHIAF